MFAKKKLDIMPNIKSKDKYNRKTIPKEKIKDIPPPYKIKLNKTEKSILNSSILYVKKFFNKNVGPEWKNINSNSWNIPLTYLHAKSVFKYFIKNKLEQGFGKYQDYLFFPHPDYETPNSLLYHSGISSSLNIGLLNPHEIIEPTIKSNNINSKEAFIRQLFWREYQRYCYNYCKNLHSKTLQKGYFKAKKYYDIKKWYNGTIDILPIDYCIKKAFNEGYLHHIERLMVVGNFMLLSGVNPQEGFKWFMEFSIDSYEWVMYQNVYDMVFYITKGQTMTRPYISSSNYILKMSNLTPKMSEYWSKIWDKLYDDFLKKNKGNVGYPYEW